MEKEKLEVADIFRQYRRLLPRLSYQKTKIIDNIIRCRTGLLGTTVYQCDECGIIDISHNSCRDRHCPKCQHAAKAKWVEERVRELLPTQYFHVVFTLPHVFNEVALTNKELIYDLLFKAASKAVRKVFKEKYHADPGMIAILHTWGQNLSLHPHVHMVIPGGGLTENGEWVECKRGFFLSVKVLSAVFRGIFTKLVTKALRINKITFLDVNKYLAAPSNFQDLIQRSHKEDWVVYSKKPFSDPLHVLKYLGGYTHRIAFSNYRLVALKNNEVYFTYKDYRSDGKRKIMKLHVKEFMRRFLLHVVPKDFVRIRYFGILSNTRRKNTVTTVRQAVKPKPNQKPIEDILAEFKKDMPVASDVCRSCKKGRMIATRDKPQGIIAEDIRRILEDMFDSS